MLYSAFSLNGAWEMDYAEEKYTSEKPPPYLRDVRSKTRFPYIPAARWLKKRILDYVNGESFESKHTIDRAGLHSLIHRSIAQWEGNTNFAFNPNDKTTAKKKIII